MSEQAIHERLRRIRMERGDTLAALAQRSGLRLEWLQAIDEGRFGDLPTGIYGRSAIRRFAVLLEIDPEEVLQSCLPHLRAIEDPIAALGRLRGIPSARPRPAAEPEVQDRGRQDINVESEPGAPRFSELPSWRMLAAAALDALVVVGLLIVVVTGTVAVGIPVSGFGRTAAPAFALLALVLGSCYFLVFGGLVGETIGELVAPIRSGAAEHAKLDAHAVSTRTLECVLRDVLFIELLGRWIGRFLAHHGWPGGMSQARQAERRAA